MTPRRFVRDSVSSLFTLLVIGLVALVSLLFRSVGE